MRKKIKQEKSKLAIAHLWTSKGVLVAPLYGFKQGHCSCGNDECAAPGRHPRIPAQAATNDDECVESLWECWPKAPVGIGMGKGLIGVATDGAKGWGTLQKLAKGRANIPQTVTIRDGEQKVRLFRISSNHVVSPRTIAEGVMVLGEGDFVPAPSSTDGKMTGRRFAKGLALGDVEIAPVPEWLRKCTERVIEQVPIKDIRIVGPKCASNSTLTAAMAESMEEIGQISPAVLRRWYVLDFVFFGLSSMVSQL